MQKTSIKTPLSQYLYLTLLPINIKKSNVMYNKMKDHLCKELAEIKEAGLYKEERIIESPQRAAIEVKGKEVLNFCANNYLGLPIIPDSSKERRE